MFSFVISSQPSATVGATIATSQLERDRDEPGSGDFADTIRDTAPAARARHPAALAGVRVAGRHRRSWTILGCGLACHAYLRFVLVAATHIRLYDGDLER